MTRLISSCAFVLVLVLGLAAEAGAEAAELAPLETLTIPASSSIHGNAGAFFVSDLWAMNRSFTQTLNVTARYRCFLVQSCPSGTKNLVLLPRASVLLQDVAGTFFGAPESAGAIELTYDAALGKLSATSRSYSPPQPAPGAGTAIAALPSSATRQRAVFLGLSGNGGILTSGFRSNAGAYNPNTFSVPVSFAMFDTNGAPIGTVLKRTYAANEAFQVNNIFGSVGAGFTVTENAYLIVNADAPIFPYVSVIDNVSGDSINVIPTDDEPPVPALAGNWSGTWNNTTFGSSGPAALALSVNEAAQTFTASLTLGGNVFGVGLPGPVAFSGSYAGVNGTISGTSTTFGTYSITVTPTGNLNGTLSAVPVTGVGTITVTGTVGLTQIQFNYGFTFFGSPVNGNVVLNKQ
jgi:hypothetical protein